MFENIMNALWLALILYSFYIASKFHRIAKLLDKVCDELEQKVREEMNE